MSKSAKHPISSTVATISSMYQRAGILTIACIFAVIGIISLQFSSAFTVSEDSPIRFSLGNQSIETTDGNVWEAGGYAADGDPHLASETISGTADQELYRTMRKGIRTFTVGSIPNGRYKVMLLFADTESNAKNERVFRIHVEGDEEHKGLDIFRKSGGKARAYKYDFTTKVSDGELSIDFDPVYGTPILSAVELLPRKLEKTAAGNIPEPTVPSTSEPDPTPSPNPNPPVTPTPPLTPPVTLPTGGREVNVSTSEELTNAIAAAQPGDIITMADGRYNGKKLIGKYTGSFAATVSGTEHMPIILRGSRNAVIDGNGTGGRYGLYLVGANYWRLIGFTVTDATKGIVFDNSSHGILDNLLVTKTGQEGVHFRSNSSDNTIMNSEVSHTGLKNATYGEGVYLGSANSNWGTYTAGQPDRSDRNQVLNNKILFTGAESIDIKEGTTGGVIAGNTFDGEGMSGSWADSWIDVKGNNYSITNNTGRNALQDGFQIHVAISGWGNNNYFAGNVLNVNGPGYGLTLQSGTKGNIWKCDNFVNNAAAGSAVVNGKTPFTCTE